MIIGGVAFLNINPKVNPNKENILPMKTLMTIFNIMFPKEIAFP